MVKLGQSELQKQSNHKNTQPKDRGAVTRSDVLKLDLVSILTLFRSANVAAGRRRAVPAPSVLTKLEFRKRRPNLRPHVAL